MMHSTRRRLLVLSFGAAFSAFATSAAAEEPGRVVRPAPTLTDPKTGTQSVEVPPGCTPVQQSTGQLVILCPYVEPGSAAAASAEPAKPRTDSKWYGWQILIVDGAVISSTLLLAAAAADNDDVGGVAAAAFFTGYTLGGPIVHWSNGQLGRGFASLGLRVGAPLVAGLTGAALGAASSSGCSDPYWCDSSEVAVGAGLGVLVGGIAAVAIDSAVLARKTVTVDASDSSTAARTRPVARAPKLQWTPTASYDAKRQAPSIGITGTF